MSHWTSAEMWSAWRNSCEAADRFRARIRQHERKKVPCTKCVNEADYSMRCDYWVLQQDGADRHGGSAAQYRHRARELELKEGKPQTIDGVKTDAVYRRELDEERDRRWAAEIAAEEATHAEEGP